MAILRSIKFGSALGALTLFFLPWLDIQFSGEGLATQTGIQAITGDATPAGERQPLPGEDPDPLGSARWVALALIGLAFGVLLLLLALVAGRPIPDGIGSVLCGLALALLILQVVEGFPAKEALVQSASVDNASLEGDFDSSFERSMAMVMMTNIKVELLPAFTCTCVLLGIPVLLGGCALVNRLSVSRGTRHG